MHALSLQISGNFNFEHIYLIYGQYGVNWQFFGML